MYFPDLSPYHHATRYREELVHVGWLHPDYLFPTGKVSEDVVLRVQVICAHPAAVSFGFHQCEFCNGATGNGIIYVAGERKVYVAPTMIEHYIRHHSYLPPIEFIQAILAVPFQDGKPLPVTLTKKLRLYQLPLGYLTPRQILHQYKHPQITQDERWQTALLDEPYNEIEDEARWGDGNYKAMIEVLSDPQYNRERSDNEVA